MGDARVDQYWWCYMCCRVVTPTSEPGTTCPYCGGGFVEEMGRAGGDVSNNNGNDLESERAFSLWAPILLGLMGGLGSGPAQITSSGEHSSNRNSYQERSDEQLEREFGTLLRGNQRRSSAALRILQGLHRSENSRNNGETNNSTSNQNSVLLVNPFIEEALILPNPLNVNLSEIPVRNMTGSFGDYHIGPGLDVLLQHLAENDPNRYGTPPAQKEAVKAMPTVAIEQNLQCPICLDEFEIGAEAKMMPCKHKFHGECIIPWLEVHSSCPVCRFQMPSNESKSESNGLRSDPGTSNRVEGGDQRMWHGGRNWFPIPWPFGGLLPLQGGSQSNDHSAPVPSAENMTGSASAENMTEH